MVMISGVRVKLTDLCNIALASGRQSYHDDTYFCILDLDANSVNF